MRDQQAICFCLLDDWEALALISKGREVLEREIRSFTEPNGFRNSHFPCATISVNLIEERVGAGRTRISTPVASERDLILISGVFPDPPHQSTPSRLRALTYQRLHAMQHLISPTTDQSRTRWRSRSHRISIT